MSHLHRSAFTVLASMIVVLAISWAAPPLEAQDPGDDPAARAGEPEAEPQDELTRKERKLRAKEARIAEYLRKKEEKRARREQRQDKGQEQEQQATLARQLENTQIAAEAAASAPRPSEAPKQVIEIEPRQDKPRRARAAGRRGSSLPRNLARAQKNVRLSALGQDPTVQDYLALIDRQQASAYQLAAFANFLAESGLARDALQYYNVALRLVEDDPVLWVNAGTLNRQLDDTSAATSAYQRALAINPNYALAHYNLGAIMDQAGRYEDAVESYKLALTLDPTLGDPAYNPQAANNDRLLAVKLMLYEERTGSLGLPLVDVPAGPRGRAEPSE